MIFFTIAFGQSHVASFFRNALYSVLQQNEIDKVGRKYGLNFLIGTTKQSEAQAKDEIARIMAEHPDCHFDIISVEGKDDLSGEDRGLLVSVLLRLCMIHCLNENKKFFYIAPDTVYSPDVLRYALAQHEVTGRVVAIFNGRVNIRFTETDRVRDYLSRDGGVLQAYLENWDDAMNLMVPKDNDPKDIKIIDHAIIKNGNFVSIFTANPNPTLGKFEMQDLVLFERSFSLMDWDHFWKERLLDQNRLYVQTNLDLGMSIELDDDASLMSGAQRIKKARERVGYVNHLREMSEKMLKTRRASDDFSRIELGSRLNMVSFSARLP